VPEPITFTPGLTSLAVADTLAKEQGLSLEQIAQVAFAGYRDGVREAMRTDLDDRARGN
jgi:hypothetical protein